MEAWDPRVRNKVGTLDCGFSCIKQDNKLVKNIFSQIYKIWLLNIFLYLQDRHSTIDYSAEMSKWIDVRSWNCHWTGFVIRPSI